MPWICSGKRFSGQIKIRAGVFVGGDGIEGLGLLAPDVEAGGGASIAGTVGSGLEERNDTVGIGEGQGLEEDGIDDGEDGRGSANAQRERGERCRRESGILAQGAQRVSQIR